MRAELAELVRSVRALVEITADSGAEGLPVSLDRGAGPRAAAERDEPTATARIAAPAPTPSSPALAPLAPLAQPTPRPAAAPPRPAEAAREERPAPAETTSPSGVPLAERTRRLDALAAEVARCTRCPLAGARTQTVFARGTPAAELVFVGEGPGADEDAQGLPFVGKAGQLLDRMIQAMGSARDEVYVCNIVKCRPPGNRKPTPEEMAACAPYLRTQLEVIAPRAVVALGATAVEGLLGSSGGITRLRGSWKLYLGRVPVMPTFHPAYLLRSP
ncbi:MAG: uracil-DNA glycosylase, partial [Polyangiaceae bacterium]|nr:uracil-DNA glycosylase [Polyangiaceae bacterium]